MRVRTLVSVFLFVLVCSFAVNAKQLVVMIDPAGHSQDAGRDLLDGKERGATLRFAEELSKRLKDEYGVQVVLTRGAGEVVLPYQNASFSNRLPVDFFIRLQLYSRGNRLQVKPKIFLYHLVFNSLVDFSLHNLDLLAFLPVSQAHFGNIHKTKRFGMEIKNYLSADNYKRYFDCLGLYGLPLKDLAGIQSPAIIIECGICERDQWKQLVEPLVKSFSFIKDL